MRIIITFNVIKTSSEGSILTFKDVRWGGYFFIKVSILDISHRLRKTPTMPQNQEKTKIEDSKLKHDNVANHRKAKRSETTLLTVRVNLPC